MAHALPPKLRQRIYIPMDPQARLRVEETKSEIACLNRSVQLGLIHSAQADAERKQLLTQFYYVTGPAKVAAVARHVQGLLESDPRKKVLVFAHHLDVLNGLEEVLLGGRRGERGSQRGYKGIRIDGATTAPKRKKVGRACIFHISIYIYLFMAKFFNKLLLCTYIHIYSLYRYILTIYSVYTSCSWLMPFSMMPVYVWLFYQSLLLE